MFAGGPTSTIPSETGYELPCSLYGLTSENVASYKVGSQTISVDRIENYMSVQTPQGTVVSANCKSGYYVFNPDKKPSDATRTYFNLKCNNGSFKRENANEYCDLKCDVSDLSKFGYIVPKPVLDPGETSSISCPYGKTTKNGKNFNVTCASGGMLNAESPACFPEQYSCTFPVGSSPGGNGNFPEGSRLVCTAPATGALTTVSCEKSKWEDNTFYNQNKSTCKETIGEINFETQNLNEFQILDITDTLTIEEIINFCTANPNDNECQPNLDTCDYRGVSYGAGHTITLYCQPYDAEINYQCFTSWMFDGFKDITHPLHQTEFVTLEDCGTNSYFVSHSPPSESRMQFQKSKGGRHFQPFRSGRQSFRTYK